MIRHLAEEGKLFDEEGNWKTSDGAEQIVDELEPLLRFGNESAGQLAMVSRARISLMRSGDVGTYAHACKEGLRAALASNNAFNTGLFQVLVAAAEWSQGRWSEAEERLTHGVEAAAPVIFLLQAGTLLKSKAYGGASEEALSIWRERRSDLPGLGRPTNFGAGALLAAAIEGLAILGCNDEVAELYPLVVDAIAAGLVLDLLSGLLQKVAGIAAACGQQWAAAEQHFDTALRQAHEIPHRVEQPEARRWYASMLLDRDAAGDRERAAVLLAEAIAMYRDIGMPKHVEMGERLLTDA